MEWCVKEVICVCREVDDDRIIELCGILSLIEVKCDVGEELSEFDKRRVEACEVEIARYVEKWLGEGWKLILYDFSYSVMFDDLDLVKFEYYFWVDMLCYM